VVDHGYCRSHPARGAPWTARAARCPPSPKSILVPPWKGRHPSRPPPGAMAARPRSPQRTDRLTQPQRGGGDETHAWPPSTLGRPRTETVAAGCSPTERRTAGNELPISSVVCSGINHISRFCSARSAHVGLQLVFASLFSQSPSPEHPIPFSITCAARSFRKSRDPAPIIAPNRTVTESHLLGVCSVTDAKQNGVLFGLSPAATMWPPRLPRAMDNAAASSALTRARGRQLDHTTPQAHS